MKLLLKALVFSVTAILPLQPLFAAGLCAHGSCSQTTCMTACCNEMGAQVQSRASQNCHTATTGSQHSVPDPHRCGAPTTQTDLALDVTKVSPFSDAASALVIASSTALTVLRFSVSPLPQAPGNRRNRHLILQVFRI